MNLANLLRARRNNPKNQAVLNKLIRKKYEKTLENLSWGRQGAGFFRQAGRILGSLPRNFAGRSKLVDLVIDRIRDIRNRSNLDAARKNLGAARNRNVLAELNSRSRALAASRRANNLSRRPYESESEYYGRVRGRMEGRSRAAPPRRYNGESNGEWSRRQNEYERSKRRDNEEEMAARRRGLASRVGPRPNNGGGAGYGGAGNGGGAGGGAGYGGGAGGGAGYGGGAGGGAGFGGGAAYGGGATPPPPLPPGQQRAITNVGGANRALSVVAAVPGGANEVAKAAEALNETGGNATAAMSVKGASPAAIKAVQSLGGVKNTVNILEGLNTLSQAPATRRRKAHRRRVKKVALRITELNRVIEAVKKQKLISLMAHHITRTNNIHPNDEKLKKYYRSVMKSYILKRPLANIAKKAAKKRVVSR
jgi:hypothetical protein